MADHALSSRTEVAAQAVAIRTQLKVWEKEFASTHGGKKAGREDIKQNPDIGRFGSRIKLHCANDVGRVEKKSMLILVYLCTI